MIFVASLQALRGLTYIGITIILLLRFTAPFESVTVSLLILNLKRVSDNGGTIEALRPQPEREKDERKFDMDAVREIASAVEGIFTLILYLVVLAANIKSLFFR